MIEERAVILSLEPQADQHSIATIEVVRKTACGLCGQTRGCGNSIWGKLFRHKSTNFTAHNRINARVGDHVIVGIEESALLRSALLLYLVPLAFMFVGAIVVARLTSSEAVPLAGAAIGLVLGLLWVKGHTTGRAYYLSHQPDILRLDNTEQEKVIQFQ